MPLFVYERLGLGGVKPTRMSLQLTDKPIKYLVGIVKDVQIRIMHMVIPINFVMMNIQEDTEIPILLGRPFLATSREIIDVKRVKLTLEVSDENIEFLLSKLIKKNYF